MFFVTSSGEATAVPRTCTITDPAWISTFVAVLPTATPVVSTPLFVDEFVFEAKV
jgi:hypothetical protein